ncbi:succinylglutamate desuccinylase [Niveibacterium sp. SC-1]|uniref:succinylglutamate desuccinylase n=1 Tax=Niveibacterium sp. SC-1 TaxID=3135646 RepID=UPI00311F4058
MNILSALLADSDAELERDIPGCRTRRIAQGVWECLPEHSAGSPLVLCAGIHGDETGPVEVLAELVDAACMGELLPRRPWLFAFGNLAALRLGRRYLECDLNRCFRGAPHAGAAKIEVARAHALSQALSIFALHGKGLLLDLHSTIRASLHPSFAIRPTATPGSGATPGLLATCGVPVLVEAGVEAPTFSATAAREHGYEAYTFELGRVRALGAGSSEELDALRNGLWRLIEAARPPESAASPRVYRVKREILKRSDDFALHVPADAPNFLPLQTGQLLAEDSPSRWFAEEGECLLFPNPDVAPGTRAVVLVRPVESGAT